MFSDVESVVIHNGKLTMHQQVNHHYAQFGGLDSLKSAVSSNAFHNSDERFNPPRCHIRTRKAVLARIMQWARREIDHDKLIMWVYGAAGTGKSAIEQTIAEQCDAAGGGIFLLSFFFSRNDGSRNHSKAFVPTIAYQMTTYAPKLQPLIESTLDKDPLLLRRSLETQMTRLIIEPFQRLLESTDSVVGRYFIIIDGLDECMDGTRIQIIKEIQRLVFTFRHESRFIASFASRPEPDIKKTFLYTSVSVLLTRVALDDDYRADGDIRLFLSDKFAEIQRTSPRISKAWPTPSQLGRLVEKASGQFIYASTVYNFVSSPHHNPVKRLDVVLGLSPVNGSSPFAQLDALYRQILLSVPSDCVDEGIKTIVHVHVMASAELRVYIPAASRISEIDETDFRMHLDNYASIVSTDNDYARPLHASLGEFLFDAERSKDLHRNLCMGHAHIFERLMQTLSLIPWEREIRKDVTAPLLMYAFENCFTHLERAIKTASVWSNLRYLFLPSFIENVTNPPPQSTSSWWCLTSRVNWAVKYIFSPLLVRRYPRSVKQEISSQVEKECRDCAHRLLETFMKKTTPGHRRLIKFLVTPRYKLYSKKHIRLIPGDAPIQNLFNQPMGLYSLSQAEVTEWTYFGNPDVPKTERFLHSNDYLQLSVCLLSYLRGDNSAGVDLVHRPLLKDGKQSGAPKYQAHFLSRTRPSLSDGLRMFHTAWPKCPAVVHPDADANFWGKAAVASVKESAKLALYFLPWLLGHAPLSHRLLQLCKQPNLKRFPWVIWPGRARKAAKAMSRYRNQIKPRHVRNPRSVPEDDSIQAITDDAPI